MRRINLLYNHGQQHDVFTEALTVKEHLWFHSKLRNIKNPEQRIKQVIKAMKLEKCQYTKIGSSGGQHKTLSGGEKKRTSFATNILAKPKILFADEPTSGLDSNLAYSVVKSLRHISRKQGTTVLCTIHQPSSESFQMFDNERLLR